MKLLPALALALAVAAAHAGEPCPAPAQILRKAFVPSAKRRHGEVRLVVRPACGEAGCTNAFAAVETVLFTTQLARGFHRIHEEEETAWPEGSAHRTDSLRYRAALDSARAKILRESLDPGDINEPVRAGAERHQILIRFSVVSGGGRVEIATAELAGTDGDGPVEIVSTKPLEQLEVSSGYVRASLAKMMAATFEAPEDEAGTWIAEAVTKAGLNKP